MSAQPNYSNLSDTAHLSFTMKQLVQALQADALTPRQVVERVALLTESEVWEWMQAHGTPDLPAILKARGVDVRRARRLLAQGIVDEGVERHSER